MTTLVQTGQWCFGKKHRIVQQKKGKTFREMKGIENKNFEIYVILGEEQGKHKLILH